jgi:hypothetical protein
MKLPVPRWFHAFCTPIVPRTVILSERREAKDPSCSIYRLFTLVIQSEAKNPSCSILPLRSASMATERKGFKFYLGLIVLAGLGVELVLRPIWPDLIKGESALTPLIRLALALMGLELTQ